MRGYQQHLKTIFVWIGLFLFLFFAWRAFQKTHEEHPLDYSQFVEQLAQQDEQNKIVKVEIQSQIGQGNDITAFLQNGSLLKTYAPYDDKLSEELRSELHHQNIPISYVKPEDQQVWLTLLSTWLPLILIVGFMVLLMKNMQGAGSKAFSFGKSKAKLSPESKQKITFKDVAGIDEAKQDCQEIVMFLKDYKKFQDIGARIPKGVLMMGPPGTGKTLLARAIAGEAGVPFFHISGSDFVEMFVGVGASRVRDLFENAKKNSPCIVFIDEIDAVGRHRGAGYGGGHDEREQTLNQLLVEMDGFDPYSSVIVVAATNRPDVLDPALLRPGRFDRRVTVSPPDMKGRKEILEVYLKKIKSSDEVDSKTIALGCPGFVGADLENLVNEAALKAAQSNKKFVTQDDFEYAKDKIIMGPERRSLVLTKENLKITSYHETGHALVALKLKSKAHVHKVTIIPRGRALGLTAFLPSEDIYNHSKEDLLTQIAIALAGRAAEELKFKHFTTGASDDIERATSIARAMITRYGMSDIGPLFTAQDNDPFHPSKPLSESLASEIDSTTKTIMAQQYQLALKTLENYQKEFDHVAEILIELETLEADDFLKAVEGASLEEIRKIQYERLGKSLEEPKDGKSAKESKKEASTHLSEA
jgi:cell division protease FtsH